MKKNAIIGNARLHSLAISIVFCISLNAHQAVENTSPDEVLQSLSLEDLLNVKLSTGSFLELDQKNSPLSMTIITSEQIGNSGARNLSELAEIYVPGFQYMINKWNGKVWGLRGVVGDRNDKIIVLVNGRKQNMQAYHGFATEYSLGLLGDIERVEVLRGPAGLVYGSGAIAGVFNIVTKKGDNARNFITVKQDVNEKNAFFGNRVEGGLHLAPSAHVDVTGYLARYVSKGLGQNEGKVFGNYEMGARPITEKGYYTAGSPQATRGNYLGSADITAGNFSLYLRGSSQEDEMAPYYLPAPWATTTPKNGDVAWIKDQMFVYNDTAAKNTDNYHNGWLPNRRTHIRQNATVNAQYDIGVGEDKLTIDGGIVGNTNRLVAQEEFGLEESIIYTNGERRYEIGLKYLLKRVENLQAALGVQYGYYDIGHDLSGQNAYWVPGQYWIKNLNYHNFAAFGEGYYSFREKLGFELGARFDKHTTTDGVLSPKAAFVFNPNYNNTFKIIFQSSSNNADVLTYELQPSVTTTEQPWTYEHGSEVPSATFDSLYSVLGDSVQALAGIEARMGNLIAPVSESALHNLKPEKARSIELAAIHTLADMITIQPSVSYTFLSDLFLWNTIKQRTENLGEFQILTADIDLSMTKKIFAVGLNTAFMRPMNLDNSPTEFTRPIFDPSWSIEDNAWIPKDTDKDTSISVDIMKYQVSDDGDNFNSLNTVITKLYGDLHIGNVFTVHTDLRVFWGLRGRKAIHESFDSLATVLGQTSNFLDMDSKPMVKWNLGMLFRMNNKLSIDIFAYDILGEQTNRHAVRWQQMAAQTQTDYFTVDQRTFALRMNLVY